MSIFGDLRGLLGDYVEKHGGAEAVVQNAIQSAGGIEGVVGKLRQAGYGDQVQSWLGAGPNEPVTADGIARAIGHGAVGAVAQRHGVSPDQVTAMLARVLPGLVDRLSPHGALQPPASGAP